MLVDNARLIVCKVEDKKLRNKILQRQFHGANLDVVTDERQSALLSYAEKQKFEAKSDLFKICVGSFIMWVKLN